MSSNVICLLSQSFQLFEHLKFEDTIGILLLQTLLQEASLARGAPASGNSRQVRNSIGQGKLKEGFNFALFAYNSRFMVAYEINWTNLAGIDFVFIV